MLWRTPVEVEAQVVQVDDVGGDVVQELAVVGDHHKRLFPAHQVLLQPQHLGGGGGGRKKFASGLVGTAWFYSTRLHPKDEAHRVSLGINWGEERGKSSCHKTSEESQGGQFGASGELLLDASPSSTAEAGKV